MIRDDGYGRYSIWEHSATVRELYARRARMEAEEMTCAVQAADLLAPLVAPGDSLLDAGCGAGYFWHSLRTRDIPVEYWGVDASPALVAIGREHLSSFGLPPERLKVTRLEDLDGEVDHVVCMNVLSNIDNYHRPLERLLTMARKSVILRESITQGSSYSYVIDEYLDPGHRLRVHVNHYDADEMLLYVRSFGFSAELVTDRRTLGEPEDVIGYPHHWTFLVATRTS